MLENEMSVVTNNRQSAMLPVQSQRFSMKKWKPILLNIWHHGTTKTRKRGRTLLLTDTPTKQKLETEAAKRKKQPTKKRTKKQKKLSAAESSDSEPEEEMPVLTDEEEADDMAPAENAYKTGDYVLVKVFGKTPSRFKKFVAVVGMVESDGDLLVTFLKKVALTKYTSTEEEDWVGSRDVIKVLPTPVIGDRVCKRRGV